VQHKNYKSFLNLSYHKEDFSIDASWVLLATSHGKTPCDGIGKQQLTRTSLMHPAHDQLLTAERVFQIYTQSVSRINKFFFISKASWFLFACYLQNGLQKATQFLEHALSSILSQYVLVSLNLSILQWMLITVECTTFSDFL